MDNGLYKIDFYGYNLDNSIIIFVGSAFLRGSRRVLLYGVSLLMGVESVDAVPVWQLIIHPYYYMGKTKVFSL
ncbi:hypothetical protein H8356DRAFT_1349980 [Neocallimastix lanati (nom. inval.)]|nr:hypothetical protein H8356DRAFT_1349980 [Neocallimastix sp. JGI-2020a]